ncbi:penicillin-binding transpeptidase domain-containing protein [Puia sp.]|jgi:beta-lactamase class D|uniref:penicillin-binding transpeptidase domain-containing protein n=1 Tax=Puia sp. TaxID=2045100 RepID=UPI002F41811B
MPKLFFTLLLIPVLFTACSTNNVNVDDSLQKYFDSAGVKGCFGLFDNGQGSFTIYNLRRFRDSAYPPGGTFDVLQGLIGLQTGAVPNDTSKVFHLAATVGTHADTGWISGEQASLQDIFKREMGQMGSNQLAALVGKDSIKKWVDSLRYGNRDVSELGDSGLIHRRLRITADEQLGLTKKLYFDQLPFFQRPQQLVRKMFFVEETTNYRLVYKTGKTTNADGKPFGWIMGWVEENKHPYFFVVNMETANAQLDVPGVGLQLVKNILRTMGFFAGKK